MYSLLKVKFNWVALAIIAILLQALFPDVSWYSKFAILISIHQFSILFNSIGYVIPVRYLFGALMCLQILLGPMLAYNGLDKFQPITYQMKIPENVYFAYAIPALLCFILGLHITAGKLNGEIVDIKSIINFVRTNTRLSYIFILIGFISSVAAEFFSKELAFIFILLGGFKFIGLFLIILGNQHLKLIPLIVVIGSIISTSLTNGMFHDLLTWVIFCCTILAIKFKPEFKVKLIASIIFILISVVIQQLKGDYRESTWQQGNEGGIETLSKTYQTNKKSLFDLISLAKSNIRINQGFIVTNIMANIPGKMPFSNGNELLQILESAVLPRILDPNKLNAGDRDFFMKYSGMHISQGTSMGLSSLGDAYINFGIRGGCIFMFFLGLLYSEVLKIFHRFSITFPLLILFTPLVFYYPIRPDCELQTVLGHLIKSCFLIFAIHVVWRNKFRMPKLNI